MRSRTVCRWLVWLSLASATPLAAAGEPLQVLSTQFGPALEAKALRDDVFAQFREPVEFRSATRPGVIFEILDKASRVDLLIARCGQLIEPQERDQLIPLAEILGPAAVSGGDAKARRLCSHPGSPSAALPWLRASYVMVARREALAYLPPGADLETLSVAELTSWARILDLRTGEARLGLPAGPNGLMHRFIQGYLYPAYTGRLVTMFQSKPAHRLWEELAALWSHVNAHSLTYDGMVEPLDRGEVWIGFDHIARLRPILAEEPDGWVVFRPPGGPAGRAYLDVVIALSVPKKSGDAGKIRDLIGFLRQPRIEGRIAAKVGFLPLRNEASGANLPPGLARLASLLDEQDHDGTAIRGTLPRGLSGWEAEFNAVFMAAFSEIVLQGAEVGLTLKRQAALLDEIFRRSLAPCWPPDPPGVQPCRVQ